MSADWSRIDALVFMVAGSWLVARIFVRLRETVSLLSDFGVKPMDVLLNGPILPDFPVCVGWILILYSFSHPSSAGASHLSTPFWALYGTFLALFLLALSRPVWQRRKARQSQVSRGALWEQFCALRRKARAPWNTELRVVPDGFRAWAGSQIGPSVLIRRSWLDRLSRAEIDALAARQIARVQREYSLPINAFILAAGFAAAACCEALNFGAAGWWLAWFATVCLEVLLLSRYLPKAWLAADLRAIQMAGDAEAFISALGELARLNDAALDAEALMTIASIAGVPRSRAQALLLEQPRPTGDRYPTSGEYATVGF